jgi:thioredoxin-related protein
MKHFLGLILILPLLAGQAFGEMKWATTWDEALKAASREDKPIILYFYVDWCPHCRRMEQEVFADPEFNHYYQNQVWMHLNAENSREGNRLARKFGARGFPATLVMNSKGELLGRFYGGMGLDQFMARIDRILGQAAPARDEADTARASPTQAQSPATSGRKPLAESIQSENQRDTAALSKKQPVLDALEKKDYRGALQLLRDMVYSIPEGSEQDELLFLMGCAYFQLKDWPSSQHYISVVLEHQPDHAEAKDYLEKLKTKPKVNESIQLN